MLAWERRWLAIDQVHSRARVVPKTGRRGEFCLCLRPRICNACDGRETERSW